MGKSNNTDVESVVTNLPPDAPREFSTNIGLTTPGNIASFKVYVITTTGNEKAATPSA